MGDTLIAGWLNPFRVDETCLRHGFHPWLFMFNPFGIEGESMHQVKGMLAFLAILSDD